VVAPAQEAVLQAVDLGFEVAGEAFDGHPVRPTAAAVLADALEGLVEGLAGGELVEHTLLDTGGRVLFRGGAMWSCGQAQQRSLREGL
jgi:hypothetical protein